MIIGTQKIKSNYGKINDESKVIQSEIIKNSDNGNEEKKEKKYTKETKKMEEREKGNCEKKKNNRSAEKTEWRRGQ